MVNENKNPLIYYLTVHSAVDGRTIATKSIKSLFCCSFLERSKRFEAADNNIYYACDGKYYCWNWNRNKNNTTTKNKNKKKTKNNEDNNTQEISKEFCLRYFHSGGFRFTFNGDPEYDETITLISNFKHFITEDVHQIKWIDNKCVENLNIDSPLMRRSLTSKIKSFKCGRLLYNWIFNR
jgi:hypothetical protein